jgi:hypothetical protein
VVATGGVVLSVVDEVTVLLVVSAEGVVGGTGVVLVDEVPDPVVVSVVVTGGTTGVGTTGTVVSGRIGVIGSTTVST